MAFKKCSILNGDYLSPDCSQLDKVTGQPMGANHPCSRWDALFGVCYREATALEQSGGWLGQVKDIIFWLAILIIIIALFFAGKHFHIF